MSSTSVWSGPPGTSASAVVPGQDAEAARDAAVRHRDAGGGRDGDRAGHARHDLDLDARRRGTPRRSSPPRPNTYGSPPLSRTTIAPRLGVLDQQRVDLVLRHRVVAAGSCRRRSPRRRARARPAGRAGRAGRRRRRRPGPAAAGPAAVMRPVSPGPPPTSQTRPRGLSLVEPGSRQARPASGVDRHRGRRGAAAARPRRARRLPRPGSPARGAGPGRRSPRRSPRRRRSGWCGRPPAPRRCPRTRRPR